MLYKQREKCENTSSQVPTAYTEFGSLCSDAVNIDKCAGRLHIKGRPVVMNRSKDMTHGKRAEARAKISISFIILPRVEWSEKTEIITKLFSTTS